MLRLRPYHPLDADKIVTWLSDRKLFELWSAGRFVQYPPSAEELNAFYEKNGGETLWGMTAFDEEGTAGHVMMRYLDPEKRDPSGIDCSRRQTQGKGIWTPHGFYGSAVCFFVCRSRQGVYSSIYRKSGGNKVL